VDRAGARPDVYSIQRDLDIIIGAGRPRVGYDQDTDIVLTPGRFGVVVGRLDLDIVSSGGV
jgi:hypothetical protein